MVLVLVIVESLGIGGKGMRRWGGVGGLLLLVFVWVDVLVLVVVFNRPGVAGAVL